MPENTATPGSAAPPVAPGRPDTTGAATGPHSRALRLAGAAVHAYTALGTVLALFFVLAALEGDAVTALWFGLAALVVDGTDGMLARRARVKQTIPWFDGALLDNIVDYLTYVFAPVVLLWTTGALPEGVPGWLLAALPLLASSYQFCRVDAKTDDHTFLGFPSYWNVVAFYAVVLDAGRPVVAAFVVVLALLVFVPIRFLYPSRSRALRITSVALTGVWFVTYAVLLVQYPDPHPLVVAASLAYLAYYWGVSFYLTALAAARRRRAAAAVS
ncbi:CDP-alcohol phosphatidyltransferase family protein [Blastococcus sp. SYSU D00820]